MAVVHGKLADIQYIPSTVGSMYANPASTKSFVKGIVLFNGNTTSEVIKVYSVPDSAGSLGTASAANQFLEISLAPLETFVFEAPGDGIPLGDTNDSIQAVTTTASRVTIQLSGLKEV